MVLRNVSELVRNVAEELVRNVSGHVSSETVRVRNVSGSGSGTVPDVGLLPDVGGQSANFMSL